MEFSNKESRSRFKEGISRVFKRDGRARVMRSELKILK